MKYLLGLCLFLLATICQSQVVTTSGKEFWFGFMENNEALVVELEVYVSAEDSTGGIISVPGRNWQMSYSVAENTTTKITIPVNTGMVSGSESIGDKGIYLQSEKNVTVYALNKRQFSADVAVILPIEALGKEYIITSYKGDGPSLYSEFLIISTSDNTEIEITPSEITRGGHPKDIPFSISLDEGESYQVQSTSDLTGSLVTSSFSGSQSDCKNFAVFAGNEWSNVGGCGSAQDHLFEQMFPTNTWGKEFTLVPYKTRSGDIGKVVASLDETTLTINQNTISLNKGESTTFLFFESTYLIADKPISVAQFSRSQSCDSSQGDPFMIMVSPNEQMLRKVTFNALEVTVIDRYYLNVVVETTNIDRFTLDGQDVSSEFTSLAVNPTYSVAQIDILVGNHTVASDSGFIAYVYGFGNIESFGYSAGISLDNLNLEVFAFDPLTSLKVPTDSVCLGESVNLKVIGNENFIKYTWDFGDGSSAIGEEVSHAYSLPGEYFAKVIASTFDGDCGLEEESRAKIVVLDPTVKINGPPSVCPNTPGVVYTLQTDDYRNTHSWAFNEGVIQSLQNDTAVIDWGATSSSAFIQVTTTNYLGCVGIPDVLPVKINIQLDPILPIGLDTLCSSANEGSVYFVYENPTSEYAWTADGGDIVTGQGTNEITVDWSDWGTKKLYYTESSLLQDVCKGESDTLTVFIEREPTSDVQLIIDDELRQGDSLYLTLFADTMYQHVSWNFGDGIQVDSLLRTESPFYYLYNCGGDYSLSVELFTGSVCQNIGTDSKPVSVLSPELNMQNVTVTENSEIEINWTIEASPNYSKALNLYRRTGLNAGISFYRAVDPFLLQFHDIDVTVNKSIYQYYLATQEDCPTPVQTLLQNSILLSTVSETEPKESQLDWNPYIGWDTGVQHYEIWLKVDNEEQVLVQTSSSLDFLDLYKEKGFDLCYQVRALKDNSPTTSWSNSSCQNFVPQLQFYNVVTPNGDNKNETFVIDNIDQYPASVLTIIDRYGKEVFTQKGYDNSWGGTNEGVDLNSGVYFYLLSLNEPRNQNKNQKGIVTIIR